MLNVWLLSLVLLMTLMSSTMDDHGWNIGSFHNLNWLFLVSDYNSGFYGDREWKYVLPGSGTSDILNLPNDSTMEKLGQYCYLVSFTLIIPVHAVTFAPPRPPPPLSAHGVSLLPYGPAAPNDVTLPREYGNESPPLTCTVPPLFLGESVSTWTVSNNGYIYTYDR